MGATLVMYSADGKRRDFPLKDQIVIIGRNDNCGLRIPLSSVSRQHCQVELRDGDEYWVRDLGSSNGTLLNDERVVEEELEPGDQLMVGPVKFTVVIDGVPSEVKPDAAPVNPAAESATDVMTAAGGSSGAGAITDDNDGGDDRFDISFDDDDDDDDVPVKIDMDFDDDDDKDDDVVVQVDAGSAVTGDKEKKDDDDRFDISMGDDDDDFDIGIFTDDDDDDAVSALESMSDDSDIVPVFDFDDDDDDEDDKSTP